MRSPLLLPGLALVLMAGVLVVLLGLLFTSEVGEGMTGPKLSGARHGRPGRAADLEIRLQHQAPAGSRCGDDCRDRAHWLVRLEGDGTQRATARPDRDERILAIRAPARVSLGFLWEHCLCDAVPPGIRNFEIVVACADAGAERRVDFMGLSEKSWHGPFLRASLRQAAARGRYQRCLSIDDDAATFTDDEEGNWLLQEFLRRRFFPEGADRCFASISVEHDVSLRALADLIDQLRGAGIDLIEVASWLD
jgi:hypothetical protein